MNTFEIEHICRSDPFISKQFLGVFPIDQLPTPNFPSCFIANTSPSNAPGEHWVAVAFDHSGRATYFCSFGQYPKRAFRKYFAPFQWVRSNRRVQNYNSTCCGHYCISWLLFFSKGVSLVDFMSMFTSHDNDKLVVFFVNSLYCFESKVIDDSFNKF
jgi:hypothetical protein